ncbi:tRNA (adenosine(37)-N6)-dimethylallyltransferase MiaA [Sandaracinobacteroides saxicola]|uniref:tRNA dimethylallyltransferase n=2 Tax=Sandaracinobacteroides saxicola TaxID=2759707 RepID=A0A7G5IM64_9SPHN|nr:tRNA (adenosine(37)-N6)-dimethylallyltransferase MiaA [Sandaracinobacteroides saxicola]
MPPLCVIAGATASGKSAFALALAARENGIIINADASQLYADLRIISARPSPADEAAVPHRLFGTVDAADAIGAARWAELARAEIDAAWAAGQLPILVGGTGLYLRTLLDGVAPVPAIDPAVRAIVRALPTADVRAALETEDPAMAARLHPHDSQRNARALEVMRGTGRSLLVWQSQPGNGLAPRVALRPLVIDRSRAELHARADARVDAMWAAGALAEAAALATRALDPALPAMRAIGVPELLAHRRGETHAATARAAWKLATRQYIKRQSTWLRNQCGTWPRLEPQAPGQPAICGLH